MGNQTMVSVFGHNNNPENTELEVTLLCYDITAVIEIHQLDDNRERVNELESIQYTVDKYCAKQIVTILQNHFNL